MDITAMNIKAGAENYQKKECYGLVIHRYFVGLEMHRNMTNLLIQQEFKIKVWHEGTISS